MPALVQNEQKNLLLRRMDAADFDRLVPDLRAIHAEKGKLLFNPGDVADSAFFPTGAIGSLIAISPEGHRVEAGLFGHDGFSPTGFAIDDLRSPYEGTVQVPGDGFQIAAEPFRAAVAASPGLRLLLQKFANALAVQSGFTALSNAVHSIEERLARWILMCDDRNFADGIPLTHEYLSVMLAVRRPSVTTALHVLEGNHLIRSERGLVIVRNRAALEAFAGDAYGQPEREYERLLGPLR